MQLQQQQRPAKYCSRQPVRFIGGEGTVLQSYYVSGTWFYTVRLPRNQNAPADNTTSVQLMESELTPVVAPPPPLIP